jgi:hypothetical protein
MKSLFFFFCLSLTLLKADLSCYTSGLSVDFSFGSSDLFLETTAELDTCAAGEACGFAKYDIDLTVTTNVTWLQVLLDVLFGDKYSSKVDYQTCADNYTCNLVTGGADKCRSAQFVFDSWIPTSCDESDNYGAVILEYNATYNYACCTSDKCNPSTYDFSSCETHESFTNYIHDLYNCWNDEKKTFMKYLVCEGGQSAYDLVKTCYVRDSYNWANVSCRYSLTCTDELQTYLTQFGECACSAATDNGYSGVLLADFLETQWQTYCPNIDLSCADNGALEAYLTYYYVYYTFYLDLAYDQITADVKLDIIDALANAVYVNTSVVDIVSVTVGNTTTSSQITVSFTTQSSSDQSNVKSGVQNSGSSAVSGATGSSVSGQSTTTSSSTQKASYSSGNSSAGYHVGLNQFFGLFVIFICVSLLF